MVYGAGKEGDVDDGRSEVDDFCMKWSIGAKQKYTHEERSIKAL